MEFKRYQNVTRGTDQRPDNELSDIAVHLLGLAGEAGSVASEYKKYLRDGPAHSWWKARMREELGDVLWYVSAIASHLDLDLDEVARANLEKTQGRWLSQAADALDSHYPEPERLPRSGRYDFRPTVSDTGRPAVTLWFQGRQIGDELTDASSIDDDYRFHDVFHLAYAVLLGWSPVTRALLKRKRKSNPATDENEDGGRAVVVEEGVAALVFAYATQHAMLEGVTRLDQRLLKTIELLVGATEAGVRTQAQWEKAILAGFEAFRALSRAGSGAVEFDADSGRFEVVVPS